MPGLTAVGALGTGTVYQEPGHRDGPSVFVDVQSQGLGAGGEAPPPTAVRPRSTHLSAGERGASQNIDSVPSSPPTPLPRPPPGSWEDVHFLQSGPRVMTAPSCCSQCQLAPLALFQTS